MRLSRCNLSCPSCDTPYTWDWSRFDVAAETRRLPATDILDWVLAASPELVVVTGGEPLLQQSLLVPLVTALRAAGRRVEVETNGTLVPLPALAEAVAGFNVSPKLGGFAAVEDGGRRINPEALRALVATGRAVFKFVVDDQDDVRELSQLQWELQLAPIWVMPQGQDPQSVLEGTRWLAEVALVHGWNLTTRLHVLVWGDMRGR